MPFTIALSGLNAASADLAVTANNIANGSTTGFKSSRAEFADLFAVTPFGVSSTATGNGVKVSQVSQQFTQGNIDFTDNNLDLALSGDGFFTMSDAGALVYSRAGSFKVDNAGYVVSSTGARMQVYPPLPNGGFNTGGLSDLQLVTNESAPQPTSMIDMALNLPADATAPVTAFDPADTTSYNRQTSMTVYDSLGAAHTTSFYFVKGATANQWTVQAYTDGAAVGTPQPLEFDSSGAMITPASGNIAFPAYPPTTGAAPIAQTLDLTGATQYGSNFSVKYIQDGFTTGALSGIDVDPSGVVSARYTNGRAIPLGQVAITNFANVQGLQKLGDTQWGETFTSGGAQRGEAGSSGFGSIQSGALESSNVEITQQLVNMIIAQRNFQANAQMISTADQITQTIINIR